jgi:hypothetical protein
MTTAPPKLLALVRRLENAIPSAVFSGIVGDSSHTYGFHLSGSQLRWDREDYSLRNDDNWSGARAHPDWASAFDMSMSAGDMTLIHSRIRSSWADPNDDRLAGWYEHVGAIHGRVSRLVSYEPEWGEFFDSDETHTWHEHTSCRRSTLDDQRVMDALYSVWTGQRFAEWAGQGASAPEEEDAMEYRRLDKTAPVFAVSQTGISRWVLTEGEFGGDYSRVKVVSRMEEIGWVLDPVPPGFESRSLVSLIAERASLEQVNPAALAKELAPLLPSAPSADQVAARVVDLIHARTKE